MASIYTRNNDPPSMANSIVPDTFDARYRTCRGKVHVIEASKWVNFGQAAVAIVEMALFVSFYLIDWYDRSMSHVFDTRLLVLGVSLFAMNVFFACILYAGIRNESYTMIVANLGWTTVSAALRGLSIVLLIVELIHYPKNALWLSPILIAAFSSLAVHCLSVYVLTRAASFINEAHRNQRRLEANRSIIQYWRPPPYQHQHNVSQAAPPPPYEIAVLTVPALPIDCTQGRTNNDVQAQRSRDQLPQSVNIKRTDLADATE